ncbi:MAG TPA: alpha/beta hydrolase [Pyrinomonadaceae bacterium]|nr:alpha/beta hydrolase [Pyrinomonadaceae bacterium]
MKKRYLFAGLTGVVAGAVATKLLTRPRDVSWPDSLEFVYNPECSWFTRVDGVRMHYQEAGDEDATPLILIHGFISSNSIWSHVLLPLAHRGFRAIAPDLPGYGYSEKPADAKYSIVEQARAVIGLMDRLHIKKAIVVGASYGGAVAATMALDYPDRVHKLIMIGAVTNDDAKKKFLLRVSCLPLIGDIATPLFLGSRWILRKRMQAMYRRMQKPINEKMVASRHHLLAAANTHRAMIRTARAWSANRIEREASLIRQPTMIVWGDQDDHFPLDNAFRLRDAIPNSKLIVFRNCGHLPPAEHPGKFVDAVADFC